MKGVCWQNEIVREIRALAIVSNLLEQIILEPSSTMPLKSFRCFAKKGKFLQTTIPSLGRVLTDQ